jgi:hypothetical protein
MDTDSLDSHIIKTIDRLTSPSRDETAAPNCVSFQRIMDEFATLDERKRATARILELKDMNVISFYRTDPIIVTLTGEFHESLDDYTNQHIAEWRRRFYPLPTDPGKVSGEPNQSLSGEKGGGK